MTLWNLVINATKIRTSWRVKRACWSFALKRGNIVLMTRFNFICGRYDINCYKHCLVKLWTSRSRRTNRAAISPTCETLCFSLARDRARVCVCDRFFRIESNRVNAEGKLIQMIARSRQKLEARSGIYLMQQSRDGKWNTLVADTMCLTAENTTRRRMRNTMPHGHHESTRARFNESVMFYEEASMNVAS